MDDGCAHALLRRQARAAPLHVQPPRWPSATPPCRDGRTPRQQLMDSLEGALPLDEERRRHWMVTIALCAHAVGDDELSEAQRDAYRAFRVRVAQLAQRCGPTRKRGGGLAERLIAAADGISVQALFDEHSWSPDRQRAPLDEPPSPLGL